MTILYKNGRDKLPPLNDNDFYATPPGFARAALEQLPANYAPFRVLDPGAGTGVWGRAVKDRWPDSRITGVDLRDIPCPTAYFNWCANQDFLAYSSPVQYDLIIGNPPFKHAELFVRHSMTMLNEGGAVLFLLRLAFLEGQDRYERLYRDYPPRKVVVSSRRIAFTGNSNPNSYALYLWQKGWTGETTLGWMLHEDNAQEDAQPSAWRQLSMFDEV